MVLCKLLKHKEILGALAEKKINDMLFLKSSCSQKVPQRISLRLH